jgi:predicted small secreted protein
MKTMRLFKLILSTVLCTSMAACAGASPGAGDDVAPGGARREPTGEAGKTAAAGPCEVYCWTRKYGTHALGAW